MAEVYKTQLKGSANPNFRNAGITNCLACGKQFKTYHDNKYCCKLCAIKNMPRTAAKKDSNHEKIVEELEAGGARCMDMSKMGNGFPDLLVWHLDMWHVVEIKNPQTAYGKKGLNKRQKEWATEWQGGPVYVVRTSEDCQNFVSGRFEMIENEGGCSCWKSKTPQSPEQTDSLLPTK